MLFHFIRNDLFIYKRITRLWFWPRLIRVNYDFIMIFFWLSTQPPADSVQTGGVGAVNASTQICYVKLINFWQGVILRWTHPPVGQKLFLYEIFYWTKFSTTVDRSRLNIHCRLLTNVDQCQLMSTNVDKCC